MDMENDYNLPVIYVIHMRMNWQLHDKSSLFFATKPS